MVVIRKRKKVLQNRNAKDISCVLISINDNIDPGWLRELLEKRTNIYSRWSIREAFVNCPVLIAESGVGISACAKIGEIDSKSKPWKIKLVESEKIDIPITVDELRQLDIIKKRIPRTIQYLTKKQYETIEKLFEL